MKYKLLLVMSIGVMSLLFSGCGAKGADSGIRPKDAAVSGTEPAAASETEPAAASGAEPAAEAGESTGQGSEEKGKEAQVSAAPGQNAADNGLISAEDAGKIALEDAGVSEQEVSDIRIKLDVDDGIQEYEVEFYVGNEEYDYDIDARSGQIRSKDMEIEDDFRGMAPSGAIISEEEARRIALEKIPGAAEGDMRIHLDNDDGRTIYEGEIIFEGAEYEFEIDAADGAILKWDVEY